MAYIKGQVVDPQGHPVAEATVYFTASPTALPDIAQMTDENGHFDLTVPIFGSYRLAACSDEWGVVEKDFEVEDNSIFLKLNFKVEEK